MLQVFQLSVEAGARLNPVRLSEIPPGYRPDAAEPPLWLNLEDPEPAELKRIAELCKLPDDFLSDPLDQAERPRAGHVEGSSLIIAKASYHPDKSGAGGEATGAGHEEQEYPTVPLGIIITPGAIITVCRVPGLVAQLLPGGIAPGGGRPHVSVAIKLLEKISSRFIKHLQRLDEVSSQIEEAMQKSTRNEDLRRILQLEKTLVYFMYALKANALVLEKLLDNPAAYVWRPEERELLGDALIECRQAVEMGEIFTQIITNMSDIYASMISNNMNMVVKFLTAITLILMAPSIIVGLYGMNVPLPFQDAPWALAAIVSGTLGICWLLWRYLQKKHWM